MAGSRAFVTVITRSYLPFARVLARSLRQFHDDPLYVVCVDEPRGYFDPEEEPFVVVRAMDIVPVSDHSLFFYYSGFEACTAVRAYAHKYLLQHTDHERWMYLDSDILVTSPLDAAFDTLNATCAGLVSPHCVTAALPEQLTPVETSLQRFGIFNGGFLALRRSEDSRRFIDWFVDRLRVLCFFLYRDVFVDQLWLNFVPLQFPSFGIFRHPGSNVAYWNLHERVITRTNGQLTANGEPISFLHFSRWHQERPDAWTQGRTPAPGTDIDALRHVGRQYGEQLAAAGFSDCRSWPYGFATFRNGRRITPEMRRWYYEQFLAYKLRESDPFEHPEWFSRRFEVAAWAQEMRHWARRTITAKGGT